MLYLTFLSSARTAPAPLVALGEYGGAYVSGQVASHTIATLPGFIICLFVCLLIFLTTCVAV